MAFDAQSSQRTGGAATAPQPQPQPQPYTLLDLRNSPVPVKFTWARSAVFPSKLGVRKDVTLLDLITFKAKADLLLPTGQLIYGFSARDTLLGGRFSVNVPARVLAYEKKLSLPNGTNVAATAGLQYVGGAAGGPLRQRFKPILGAQLRLGGGGGDSNVVFSGDGFSVKQRLPLPLGRLGLSYPRVELEAFTSIRVPQLTTRFSVQGGGFALGSPGGGQARQDEALHVHVQGMNAVLRF